MQNINELVGIIRGISFDGIINDKEIERLRKWVDKNRNLAYKPTQVDLIRKVDSTLADGIITDQERELMICKAEKFINGSSDELKKIYELTGIIDGIICDSELNDDELFRLKEWMDQNGELICGHKPSEDLYDTINHVLSDGTITEEERDFVIQVLSYRISRAQFETKLDHLFKLAKSKKNIGIDLIDILDDAEAINEIHQRAEEQLSHALNSYTGFMSNDDVVFVSLVLIAMLKYDGNYYDYVRSTYTNLYGKSFSDQKIEGLIRTILYRYKHPDDDLDNRARVINIALTNSIVPVHYLSAFFEFIYDIYKLNFNCDLPTNLYDEFRFIYEGLQNIMAPDGDDVEIEVTKKSYKLIRSTKRLIINNQLDSIINLSIIIIKLIDKKVWDNETKIFNPYLKAGYAVWINTLREDIRGNREARTLGELRSRWEPEFILENRQVYLLPPMHKVKAQYLYEDIYAIFMSNGKEIAIERHPDIRYIIGGYKVQVKKIKINNPLDKIRYKLMAENECIYDSRNKLYRDFIVFASSGEEIANNTNYTGGVAICHREEIAEFKCFHRDDHYLLSLMNVKAGMTFIIEGTVLNFSTFINPGIFGEAYENTFVKEQGGKNLIQVYRRIQYLFFESSISTAKYEISINGKPHRISEYNVNVTETDKSKKYVVEIDLNSPGVSQLQVYQLDCGRRQRIINEIAAIDPELKWETVKMDDSLYLVSISSQLLGEVVDKGLYISDFSEEWSTFIQGETVYNLIIPLELEIYRLSDGRWKPYGEHLWIGEIGSDSYLDLYGTELQYLEIIGSDGKRLDEDIPIKRLGTIQRISIGFLQTHQVENDYVVMVFFQEGKSTQAIFCYNKCIIDEKRTEISYDPIEKMLKVNPYFWGKGQIYYSITNDIGEVIYRSSYLQSGCTDYSYSVNSFEHYKIAFLEKEKGLSLRRERLLFECTKVFYALDEFAGRSFKINEVLFDQFIRGEFIRKSHYLKRVFVYFDEKIEDGLFSGKLYTRTYNGNYMLDRVNPIQIEVCGDIIDETLELAITKDGDGLFLDFEHHGIKNTLDDDTAVDIFSYIIDVNGVETV